MSEKKPKSTAKNTSKKPASGKVTKPLRRASAAKSGQTSSKPDKAASNRKAKLFGRIKKSDTQGAYTSVKNRKSKMVFFRAKHQVLLLSVVSNKTKTVFVWSGV